MKNVFFLISIFISCHSVAEVERIEAARLNRNEVKRLYLAPGLGSVVLFPCALVEVFIGRSDDLNAQISPNDKKTLFLNLKLNSSLPTNLIAKCEPERNIFVFDVIPSRSKHQDLVEIKSFYGGPKTTFVRAEIKEKPSAKYVITSPKLVEKGAAR